MTIEFHCPHCDKFLKTPDDKAGRRADCPDCGEPLTVPEVSDEQYLEETLPYGGEINYDAASAGPAEVEETKDCPMCGAEIKAAAIKCRHCGEEFGPQPVGDGRISLTAIDVGDVMGTTWEIYKSNFGLCFGVAMLVFIISLIASAPSSIIDFLVETGELGDEFGFVSAILSLAANVFSIWLTLGHSIFMLNLSRGRDAQIGDVFSGSPYFLRGLGASIVVGISVVVGMLACVIPGIYLLLILWPFMYVIVDQDEGAMASLSTAREITVGNKLNVIVLFLAGMGLSILGMLAVCVGFLFVMPYVSLLWCIAYLRMTGQKIIV